MLDQIEESDSVQVGLHKREIPEKSARTRHTRQRQAVLDTIAALAGKHPTAAEIHLHLRESHPHLSLATVYRSLHALTERQAVIEMRVENVTRYDGGLEPHHHFVCRLCGVMMDVTSDVLPMHVTDSLAEALRAAGLRPDPFMLQFSGVCQGCLTDD
jgi:Fe2+ or Zn2+ uptake regulation protein